MKIKITQEDINNGVRACRKYCPIGLAITRELGIKEISVEPYGSGSDAFVRLASYDGDTVDRLLISKESNKDVVRFINNFDEERPVKPFVMEVLKEMGGHSMGVAYND
jgi:hypothetical protein